MKAYDKELDEENIIKNEELLILFAGLVTVDDESSVIRFIHFTTEEYSKRTRIDWLTQTTERIPSTCLTYLLSQPVLSTPCDAKKSTSPGGPDIGSCHLRRRT